MRFAPRTASQTLPQTDPTSRVTRSRRASLRPGGLSFRLAPAGFTLAEVLAALLFMAIVIPVALEGLRIASRAGEVAARKSEAALVAERILNESIVTTNWNKTLQSGTVVQGLREFHWTLRNNPWNQDPNQNVLRLLSVQVGFAAQGQDCYVRLSTLADTSLPLSSTTSSTP